VLQSVAVFSVPGIGQNVVQVVAASDDDARAYVVDEDGAVLETQVFWANERRARTERFGKLSPSLFAMQVAMSPADTLRVKLAVLTDLPEPQLPYDGTDQQVSIEEFENWTRAHTNAQVARIAIAKQRVLQVLAENNAVVHYSARGLPTIDATISVELLQSTALNASDVLSIDEASTDPVPLLGYAGHASMNAAPSAGGLGGGACGPQCDGGAIDVGFWEGDGDPTFSGIARNNTRLSAGVVTGYLGCPLACSVDADCAGSNTKKFCREPLVAGQKVCVQDHLSWVVASTGMAGSYSYDTFVPGGADPVANASGTFGTSTTGSGAWAVDKRFGNSANTDGLDFLIAPPPAVQPCQMSGAPAVHYLNRSQGGIFNEINFPGRAMGTFVTVPSGNTDPGSVVCARLKNGLCVGGFSYLTFNDQSTHRRWTTGLGVGSSHLNDTAFDSTLERPHLLGPSTHQPVPSGLHMPAIDSTPGTSPMRHANYASPASAIFGTSFAAPSVLGIAVQAHQFEGWFSNLVYPMVNKAVLLASTRDANADGSIGKTTTWSGNAPTQDGEDGAGQIDLAALKSMLTDNRYFSADLADSSFVSCGTGCRKKVVTTLTVSPTKKLRAALAWQACMVEQTDVPVMNNDLDLVLVCTGAACPGTISSNTVSSEVEMLERQRCAGASKVSVSCSLEIRIKNGATLQACGSTATERVGVAWRLE
jgi:hypothetical protein